MVLVSGRISSEKSVPCRFPCLWFVRVIDPHWEHERSPSSSLPLRAASQSSHEYAPPFFSTRRSVR
eukprot:6796684-Pyramimonas_sp.AAC.2